NASGDPAVSSTVNPLNTKRTKLKTEAEGPVSISPSSQDHGGGILDLSEDLDKDECKQEPEAVYETNCHWEGCTKEYETQDQLVHQHPRPLQPQEAAINPLSSNNSHLIDPHDEPIPLLLLADWQPPHSSSSRKETCQVQISTDLRGGGPQDVVGC
ncbi:hypothetical protein CHARACLAT_012841, partial [Characodon lateralis]|nr:hypothetical protein [Characodon lateralis]